MAEGAVLLAGDESSISRAPVVVGTWAPVGETPVLRHDARRGRFSALVFMSPCGLVLKDTVEGSFTGARVLVNLMAIAATLKEDIVILLDGASIHWTKEIRQWLARPEIARRITVERFPAYAPDLNPVELLNAAGKRRMGNFATESMAELEEKFSKVFTATRQETKAYFRSALGREFPERQAFL